MGAPGPHDCHGRLHVGPGETADTCRLTVELPTEQADGEQIGHGLDEALRGLEQAVEDAER